MVDNECHKVPEEKSHPNYREEMLRKMEEPAERESYNINGSDSGNRRFEIEIMYAISVVGGGGTVELVPGASRLALPRARAHARVHISL